MCLCLHYLLHKKDTVYTANGGTELSVYVYTLKSRYTAKKAERGPLLGATILSINNDTKI